MPKQDRKAEVEFSASRKQLEGRSDNQFFDPQLRRAELRLLGIGGVRDRLILDAGCGTGPYGLELAREGNKVIGVDISRDLVAVSKQWADREKLTFLPMEGNIEHLPLADGSVDICFCGFILHHLPDIQKTMNEFYRVLKPGGMVALLEPNGSNPLLKVSDGFRRTFMLKVCDDMGCCSANEKDHSHRYYQRALVGAGFKQIHCLSHHVGSTMHAERQKKHDEGAALKLLQFLLQVRQFGFFLTSVLLPQPYKYSALYVTAVKPVERK